jgi:hypothetical protein
VLDHVRVGGAAAQALHTGIVQPGIAVHRHQVSPCLVLSDVALGSHVSAAIVDAAVADAEEAHVAIAVERNVARREGILRIGADGVEAAAEILRNLSFDRTVPHVYFCAEGGVRGAEYGGSAHRRRR